MKVGMTSSDSEEAHDGNEKPQHEHEFGISM